MGVIKNLQLESEEYDYPYDFESYADFCGSFVSPIETSTKIFEDSIKDREELLSNYEKACNDRTGFPDFFTPQEIEAELIEMRQNPPRYLPEDEAQIIPSWYTGIRHLAWRIFKEEKIQRFVIASRDFFTSSFIGDLLPQSKGLYIVWTGDYDYLTAEKQSLLYVGKSKNVSRRWKQHHQAEYVAKKTQELEFYKTYVDYIPASSLAFSLRISELIFLETLESRLVLNRRF